MVSFICNHCQETVKKPKLDQHAQRCRWASFSCVDCMTDFQGTDYRAHTSCISEAEKYQKALYRGNGKNQAKNKAAVVHPVHTEQMPAAPVRVQVAETPVPVPTPTPVVVDVDVDAPSEAVQAPPQPTTATSTMHTKQNLDAKIVRKAARKVLTAASGGKLPLKDMESQVVAALSPSSDEKQRKRMRKALRKMVGRKMKACDNISSWTCGCIFNGRLSPNDADDYDDDDTHDDDDVDDDDDDDVDDDDDDDVDDDDDDDVDDVDDDDVDDVDDDDVDDVDDDDDLFSSAWHMIPHPSLSSWTWHEFEFGDSATDSARSLVIESACASSSASRTLSDDGGMPY